MNTRTTTLRRTAALAVVAAAAAFAAPTAANAAVTGANGTLTGDDGNDTITITNSGGLLQHNDLGPAFNSASDFDSTQNGDQTIPVGGTLTINSGGGNDTINAAASGLTADLALTVDGGAGDDTITGSGRQDSIRGGADDDRITAGPNPGTSETINGDAGNDVIIWNNGDGNDINEGGDGADTTLINNGSADDQMKVSAPVAGRAFFERNNNPFNIDMATERLEIVSFAGNDKLETLAGVTIPMRIDAGPGQDDITTGDGADTIGGGDDVDTLNGGGGGDRIAGNPGNDLMNGNAGDDVLVWENGDGTDDMDGGADLDRIENNLGAANDISLVKVEAGKVRYDRVNAPFGLNIVNSEVLELNTFGGNDTLDVAAGVGAFLTIDADAGSGDDRFNGGDESDTFFGGLGNDTLDAGAGSDSVDGADGNDVLLTRDGATDLARGGAGADVATVDFVDAVAADVETVNRSKSGANALSLADKGKIKRNKSGKNIAKLKLTCDASALEGCEGTLSLVTKSKVRIAGNRVHALLGSKKYDLAAGQTKALKVKLPGKVRKLAENGKLKVRAQAVSDDAAGNATTSSEKVSLKLVKPKK
jgi:Ca2+-binding RTX toxin-like protein